MNEEITIYTDASYRDGVMGYAFILDFGNGAIIEKSGTCVDIVDDPLLAEMYAMILALEFLKKERYIARRLIFMRDNVFAHEKYREFDKNTTHRDMSKKLWKARLKYFQEIGIKKKERYYTYQYSQSRIGENDENGYQRRCDLHSRKAMRRYFSDIGCNSMGFIKSLKWCCRRQLLAITNKNKGNTNVNSNPAQRN